MTYDAARAGTSETELAGYEGSPWMVRPALPRPPLLGEVSADAIVVGAGLAGALAARELVSRGLEVVVLERARLAHGTSGNSTAKVTVLHGTDWSRILRHHPVDEALREWAALNAAAPSVFSRIVREDDISCRLRYLDAYLCAREGATIGSLERQQHAMAALGVPVRAIEPVDFSPLGRVTAFSVARQAMVDPYALCSGVIDAAERAGSRLYEDTAVRSLRPEADGGWSAVTDAGVARAPIVVMASLAPSRDPALLFTRLFPYAHYAIETTPTVRTDGIWLESGGKYLTARPVDEAEGHWIFSGSSARLASDADARAPLRRLIDDVMETTGAGEPYRYWMAEDYATPDGLPFVGRVGSRDGLYYIGGFGGWGLTKSQVAASLIADLVQGVDRTGLAQLLSPDRLPQRSTWPYLWAENLFTLKHLATPQASQRHLAAPVGALGLNRGDPGPRCTHLGCRTQFNDVEGVLDCPCHGSRFSDDGEPLYGPARHAMRIQHGGERARGRSGVARHRGEWTASDLKLAALLALGIVAAAATVMLLARRAGCAPKRG